MYIMLGLPFEGLQLNNIEDCPINDDVYVDWKKQYTNENSIWVTILKKIRKTDVADQFFKLNFICLFINTFGELDMSGSSNTSLVRKLIKIEDCRNIYWCGFVLECLQKTRTKWRPFDKNCYYTGPIGLLLVKYLFH